MTHVIREQHLHVEYDGPESEAPALQGRLQRFCYDNLIPAMEITLNDQAPAHEHVYLERLEVDAGTIEVEHLEQDLTASLRGALKKALKEELSAPRASSRRKNTLQAMTEAFLYFLEKGTLPWWFRLPPGQELEQVLLDCWEETDVPGGLSRTLLEDAPGLLTREPVRIRLIQQFSEMFLSLLLALLSGHVALRVSSVLDRLDSIALPPELLRQMKQNVWEPAFAAVAHHCTITEQELVSRAWQQFSFVVQDQTELVAALERHWPGATPHGRQEVLKAAGKKKALRQEDAAEAAAGSETERQESPILPEAREGIYVPTAGVVLLHPYLPQLFEALQISKRERLLKPERAVGILHFLATGSLNPPEYQVMFPKVLCNIPLHAPIQTDFTLSEVEQEECEALLQTVVAHWGALGSSSPDGLRGSFLHRPGKLSLREEDEWLLQVESSSYDILLEQLHWSISMVKLPWMPKLLWVQWN